MSAGPLSKVKTEIAHRMRAHGSPVATIAKMLAESETKILAAFEPSRPLSAAVVSGAPDTEKARAARRRPLVTRAQTSGSAVRAADRDDFYDHLAEIPPDTRDLTGRILGDPIPGRRAIDRRNQGAK